MQFWTFNDEKCTYEIRCHTEKFKCHIKEPHRRDGLRHTVALGTVLDSAASRSKVYSAAVIAKRLERATYVGSDYRPSFR